jgi:hypothetical protein
MVDTGCASSAANSAATNLRCIGVSFRNAAVIRFNSGFLISGSWMTRRNCTTTSSIRYQWLTT